MRKSVGVLGTALTIGLAALPATGAIAADRGAEVAAAVRQGVDAASRNDYASAVRLWQGPAAAGDADAQFNLGMAYKNGLGVTADVAKAEDLFRKAATQGHVLAGDQYGLLLFQTGRRREALPWLETAAQHGEERAQYVLGTARYNGDFVPKDWALAYALMSSAAGQGLLQAKSSLAMMDQTIPLEQRQQGIAIAQELAKKASLLRGTQMAAADLGAPRIKPPSALAPAALPPSKAVDVPPAPSGPASAGASYAPLPPARAVPHATPAPRPVPKPVQVAQPVAAAPVASGNGAWRVQLGAFREPGNANALWAKVSGRPELAGKRRIDVPGAAVRLQAGGFASEAAASKACAALKADGFACLVTK